MFCSGYSCKTTRIKLINHVTWVRGSSRQGWGFNLIALVHNDYLSLSNVSIGFNSTGEISPSPVGSKVNGQTLYNLPERKYSSIDEDNCFYPSLCRCKDSFRFFTWQPAEVYFGVHQHYWPQYWWWNHSVIFTIFTTFPSINTEAQFWNEPWS